ncbi:MAG: DNA repair protein RecO [Pseudomonadota bacterium]
MQWRDDALILGRRRFGESGLILDVLTATKGRRSGLVYGGAGRKKRSHFETGNSLSLQWSGRLEEQLGRFDMAEVTVTRAARLLDDPAALAAINAVTDLLRHGLDEGDEIGSLLYEPSTLLLDNLSETEVWPSLYCRWELGLLSALGFGLDLDRCALSGANDGLTHVSPKTGRAVRGSEAEDYVDRLFALPDFLIDPSAPLSADDIKNALTLTGHFIETRLFSGMNKTMPPTRGRLVKYLV